LKRGRRVLEASMELEALVVVRHSSCS
jgi:hypothetical protein